LGWSQLYGRTRHTSELNRDTQTEQRNKTQEIVMFSNPKFNYAFQHIIERII
jgi:hypothetical protein